MGNLATYTAYWSPTVAAAGGVGNSNFEISNPGRKMILRSVVYAIELFLPGANTLIPWEQNTTFYARLRIGDTAPGTSKQRGFNEVSGSPLANTAGGIYIFVPGQYVFYSMYFDQVINFDISLGNQNANMINSKISLTVEVEEYI